MFFGKNYKLKVGLARHFDLEGYINDMRINKLKIRGFFHYNDEKEDLIRNALPVEAIQWKKKWEYLKKLERERKEADPDFEGFGTNVQNDFARMKCKVRMFDEIIFSA